MPCRENIVSEDYEDLDRDIDYNYNGSNVLSDY